MSIGGGHGAHGSVVVGPWGCTDEEVLKKKEEKVLVLVVACWALQALSRSCQLLGFVV